MDDRDMADMEASGGDSIWFREEWDNPDYTIDDTKEADDGQG